MNLLLCHKQRLFKKMHSYVKDLNLALMLHQTSTAWSPAARHQNRNSFHPLMSSHPYIDHDASEKCHKE